MRCSMAARARSARRSGVLHADATSANVSTNHCNSDGRIIISHAAVLAAHFSIVSGPGVRVR